MKLSNQQIRTVYNAYTLLAGKDFPFYVEIGMNLLELEDHVKKIEKIVATVAEKNKWLSEDKQRIVIPNDALISFDDQTKVMFAKVVEVKLEVISKKDLKAANVSLPANLITELLRHKLIA